MRVCPHPLLLGEVIAGETLRYVRVATPKGQVRATYDLLRQRPFVALHVADLNGQIVYGITSQRVANELANMLIRVDFLGGPNSPDDSDLYLLRDDLAKESGFGSTNGAAHTFFAGPHADLLLSATDEGLVVALPAGTSPGNFHFAHARHGHTLKLVPTPLLLDPAVGASKSGFLADIEPKELLSENERRALSGIDANAILGLVERYSGKQPLSPDDPRPIRSRHIAETDGDNQRAVMALARELEAIGQGRLQVRVLPFTHRGLRLYNVEAELRGVSSDLVLVTAHLDSTAANDLHFDEMHGAAPGADDDASGVAAVLLSARCFVSLAASAPPARTIRFVLFNAEEEGLVGSRIYSRAQRAQEAPIVAVYQMDMIGYHVRPPRTWEVHAGFYQSPEVEQRSLALAQILKRVSPLVSPELEPPQIYVSGGSPDGDPAEGRSDHAPFQAQGYAACVVTEDFFVGPGPSDPEPQTNPNYHSVGDTIIVADFAADIARVVAAAVWATAKAGATAPPRFSQRSMNLTSEGKRMASREIDTGNFSTTPASFAKGPAAAPGASAPRRLRLDAKADMVRAFSVPAVSGAAPGDVSHDAGSLVGRALTLLRSERTRSAGFGASRSSDGSDFIPDPVLQRTSSAAQIVHFQQFYRGIPVFRTGNTVRFGPQAKDADVLGESVVLDKEINTAPTLRAEEAVLAAAKHLASASLRQFKDEFGQVFKEQPLSIDGFRPQVISGFPMLPTQPTVLDWVAVDGATEKQPSKPFSQPVPTHLVMFDQRAAVRLGWYVVLSRDEQFEQYAIIVSADAKPGEIIYAKDMIHRARARASVFEFSPGVSDRKVVEMPRPVSDYPIILSTPLVGFPNDWVDANQTIGNSTIATLNFSTTSLDGQRNGDYVEFHPKEPDGDDQKLLNIFYYCNFMHDCYYMLGFDEAAGNFQKINLTHTGIPGDPVRARAHSGPVSGTANMSTDADGLPPIMNMGLVTDSGRHTAFDADVVFHEYTHGLTNRCVGGTRQGHALEAPQSRGMGEGWSDFFALTIINCHGALRGEPERAVIGNWLINSQRGIRSNPYDDHYPYTYGYVATLSDEHDVGEIWCAALMMMVRRIRVALGSDVDGYRLGLQMVVDGLKLTPANPTFLQARDGILLALDHMLDQQRISRATHDTVRKAALEAFGWFGMGPSATSQDAGVDGIVEDVVRTGVA
jgi:hypothetical protein